uniref:MFS domain-containing protein n=1 Tax=Parastrongyloides trichosuri TaxID=131310 RepID=A0A0N5A154_PARTI
MTEEVQHKHSFIHIRSRRFHVTLLLMAGICLFFFARTNLGFSMVCMINSTAVNLDKATSAEHRNNAIYQIPDKCISNISNLPTSPVSLKDYGGTFDWNVNVQNLILSGNFYGAIITIIPAGILADRTSPKNLLLLSGAFFIIASALFPYLAFNYGYVPLIASRVIMGLGEGISSPAFNHILANWIPKAESPVAISLYTSGVQLAGFIGNPITAYFCDSSFGWQGVFYLIAFLIIIWCLLWGITVQNSFHKAKWMHEKERKYLEQHMTKKQSKASTKAFSIPWISMVTSLPLLSTLLCNFVAMAYNFFVTMYLPTYFKDTLYVSIMDNGFYSSIPFVAQGVSKIGWGFLMTHLQRKMLLTSTQSVKLSQAVSGVGVAVGLIGITLLNDCTKPYISVICFVWISIWFGVCASGFLVSHIILAPSIVGLISSIFTITALLGAICTPWVVSLLKTTNDPDEWNMVLYVLAFAWFATSMIFVLVGSGEPQVWGIIREKVNINDKLLKSKVDEDESNF